jgi:hypothetical protein
MARTRAQSLRSTGVVVPEDAFFMSFRLSNGNDVIGLAARGMHHEHHHAVPQANGLEARLAIRTAFILAANREAREDRLGANEIKAMLGEIGEAFFFVVANHGQIVDATYKKVKQIAGAFFILDIARVPGIIRPSLQKTGIGFDSPERRRMYRHYRNTAVFSRPQQHGKPYGRVVREGTSPAGSFVRSVNPHGLALPRLNSEQARLLTSIRSHAMKQTTSPGAPAPVPPIEAASSADGLTDKQIDAFFAQMKNTEPLLDAADVDRIDAEFHQRRRDRRAALLILTKPGAWLDRCVAKDRKFALVAAELFLCINEEKLYSMLNDLMIESKARLMAALSVREDMGEVLAEARKEAGAA